jgi:Cft2 family RNA processing exonuclease
MSLKERIERIEKLVYQIAKNQIDHELDNSWHKDFDLLHEFIKEIDEESK